MARIGITGAIGSGKSFVGRLLCDRGYEVLDADATVHDMYRDNQELREKIANKFGRACLFPWGINRVRLANIIFADATMRDELESIVYPYLTKEVRNFFKAQAVGTESAKTKVIFGGEEVEGAWSDRWKKNAKNSKPCFVEAALFTRTPEIVAMLDEIWIVTAPEDVREQRLLHRGLSLEDARRRIENQRGECDESKFVGKTVRVLENSGDKSALEKRLNEILAAL